MCQDVKRQKRCFLAQFYVETPFWGYCWPSFATSFATFLRSFFRPAKNTLLNAPWGPRGAEIVRVLKFSVRFRCQPGARISTISTSEFPVFLKMSSKRCLGGFWHPFGSILGAFWSPLGSVLPPFRCPIAPSSACIRLLPCKPCRAYFVFFSRTSDSNYFNFRFISVPSSSDSSSIGIQFLADIGSISTAS